MKKLIVLFVLFTLFVTENGYSAGFMVLMPRGNEQWEVTKQSKDDLTGKNGTVLVFFLPGIKSSLVNLGNAVKLQERLPNLKFVAVTRDQKKKNIPAFIDMLNKNKFKIPIILDKNLMLSKAYGVKIVPNIIVVNSKFEPIISNTSSFFSRLSNNFLLGEELVLVNKGKKVSGLQGFANNPVNELKNTIIKDFTVTLTNGKKFNLNDSLGKPTVILFYSANEKDSNKYIKEIASIDRSLIKNVNLLPIAGVKGKVTRKKVINFLEKYKFIYPVVIDDTLKYFNKFRITVIPTLLLVNKYGTVEYIYEGYTDNLEKILKKMINE